MSPRQSAVQPAKPLDADGTRFAQCKATGLWLSMRPIEAARGLFSQWSALSKRALVPNIFYEPEFAFPASIPFGKDLRIVAVHAGAPEDGAPLLAIWPLKVLRFRWGVPLPIIFGWTHPFASTGVPLLDRDKAREAMSALLNMSAAFPGLPARALIPFVPDDGPFPALLDDLRSHFTLRETRTESHDRAFFTPGLTSDTLEHLSSGTRSKLRQELRRLEKIDVVTLDSVEVEDRLGMALETYLGLEAAGWKGRVGTAIPASPAETQFMRETVANLAKDKRVRIDQLKLGERVIASSITYRNGSVVWYAKISFDEEFAKNSPGSQLVVKVTEMLNADTSISFADSCAPPLHPLMRKFWPQRMGLSNRMLELKPRNALFPLAVSLEQRRPAARAYYHMARRWLKSRPSPKPSNVAAGE